MLDEVNSDLKDVIDSLINNLNTELVSEKSLGNALHPGDGPLELFVPEANCLVVENPTIEKTLEEG